MNTIYALMTNNDLIFTSTSYADAEAHANLIIRKHRVIRMQERRGPHVLREYRFTASRPEFDLFADYTEETQEKIERLREQLEETEHTYHEMTKEEDT